MASKNLIIKQKPFSQVRSLVGVSQSSVQNIYYVEGSGNRYYVNQVTATATPVLEAATFQSFISFTMSGFATYSMTLVPMAFGESAFIDMHIYCQNSNATKGYAERIMTAYRHSGSSLSRIGAIQSTKVSDFTTVSITFSTTATQSINLIAVGQTGETLDFDVYIDYRKGFHSVLALSTPQTTTPIYPTS